MDQHILSARQFGIGDVKRIFQTASEMEKMLTADEWPKQTREGIVILFFQRSSRTHSTFEIAANELGIPIIYSTQAADRFSSVAKGESLADTIRLFAGFPHVRIIVIRHPQEYSAQEAAEIADRFGVSIINAGDGTNEHPTQALLDLYTIKKQKHPDKSIRELRIVVANDIEYSRTIRSLLILFGRIYGPKEIGICAPRGINLPEDIRCELIRESIEIVSFHDLRDAAYWADFLYMTRPQIEYYARDITNEEEKKRKIKELEAKFQGFRITKGFMDSLSPDCKCQIMHPMPVDSLHFNEIMPDVREHPRCTMFKQATNGIPIRMALLKELLEDKTL
ncbi:hypothetical protein A2V71_03180 [Candidatus Berkelbacteria bacterium RBG_13_40_8]|uniref:Aspartate transcarbamylase n=1 Tax=Candidatus Berkelbacteria bacterium RBG_13_40_8 TaxID=1797467 RepID=A0A1F5DP72_9BACT|nr:MAG: hypothetical protein A2V71_03180 [Candidatus Berkelbacteria bacterium RBG_13_40_8]